MASMFGNLPNLSNNLNKNRTIIKFIKNQEQIKKRLRLFSQERQELIIKNIKSKSLYQNSKALKNIQNNRKKSIQILEKLKITKAKQKQNKYKNQANQTKQAKQTKQKKSINQAKQTNQANSEKQTKQKEQTNETKQIKQKKQTYQSKQANQKNELKSVQQKHKTNDKQNGYQYNQKIKGLKYGLQHQQSLQTLQQNKKRRMNLTLTQENNLFRQNISGNQLDKIRSPKKMLLITKIANKKQCNQDYFQKYLTQKKAYHYSEEVKNIITKIMEYVKQKMPKNQADTNEHTKNILELVCFYLLNLLFQRKIHLPFYSIQLFLDQKLNNVTKYSQQSRSNGQKTINQNKIFQYQSSPKINSTNHNLQKFKQVNQQNCISQQIKQNKIIGFESNLKNQNQKLFNRYNIRQNIQVQKQSQSKNYTDYYSIKTSFKQQKKETQNQTSIHPNCVDTNLFQNKNKNSSSHQITRQSSNLKQNISKIKLQLNKNNQSLKKQLNLNYNRNIKLKNNQNNHMNLNLYQERLQKNRIQPKKILQNINKTQQKEQYLLKSQQQWQKILQQKQKSIAIFQQKIQKCQELIRNHQRNILQAKMFLQSCQCPKTVRKIIRKKGQIQRNLKNLISLQVFDIKPLQKCSNPQYIIKIKQETVDTWNNFAQNIEDKQAFQQKQQLMVEFRQIFFNLLLNYSQIIEQFQAKTSTAKNHYFDFLQILKQWQLDQVQKQKLTQHFLLDYLASSQLIQSYIEKLPKHLASIQKCLVKYEQSTAQSKQNICQSHINTKDLLKMIQTMYDQNQFVNYEFHKQKRFAKILKQII